MDTIKKFTILFNANTKPLEQGIKQSQSKLKSFAIYFNGLVATYFSYKMFQGVIQGFADTNTKLAQTVELSGYNAQNLQIMGGALKRFGGDTNAVVSSLDSLNAHLQNAKFGGGALVDVARKYGVAFTNSNGSLLSAESLLKSLGAQLGKYDRQTRIAIANQLGLDKSLVLAFADGGKELNALMSKQRAFGVATQKDLKISKNFTNAILDLKDSFQGIIRTISRLLLPTFTKLLKLATRFIEYLKKHKIFIMAFFGALLVAMTPILAVFAKMAIASAAAFAPIYAAVAVVTAIALIIEDIYYYFMGWDSVTGDLVQKFPILGKILEGIRPIIMGIVNAFKWIIDFLENPSWEKLLRLFEKIRDIVTDGIMGAFKWLQSSLDGIFGKIGGFFGFGGGDDSKAAPPVVSPAGNSSNTTNNVTNNVTQNISSATPQQLADGFNELAIGSVNSQRIQRGQ